MTVEEVSCSCYSWLLGYWLRWLGLATGHSWLQLATREGKQLKIHTHAHERAHTVSDVARCIRSSRTDDDISDY